MRKVSITELLVRFKQWLRALAERIPIVQDWVLPSGQRCFRKGVTDIASIENISKMIPMSAELVSGPNSCREFGGLSVMLQQVADKSLDGRFDLLGMRDLQFGTPIDWHLEPTSGKRSPRIHWKALDNLDDELTGDKKVVWELNRHQHLLALAYTYLCTNNERYALCAVKHMTDWIRDNPPASGINWTSSLELAFRCISWLWTIAMLQSWPGWRKSQILTIKESLCAQGVHIESYLSTYYSPNTHLTGEALGLYYLGHCLPELKKADRWHRLGRSILLDQVARQVRTDGVYFEQSTWYQRYTFDFYSHFILLADRAKDELPSDVKQKVKHLLDFLMWITRPDGTSPYLGDDDGGKLLMLHTARPGDWRTVLSTGAAMFSDGQYKFVAGDYYEETYFLLGESGHNAFRRIPAVSPQKKGRAFHEGGYFVMRSGWTKDANFLLIDCGPHGMMNCGHAHADALSFELSALGTTFLVDPGTYSYTNSSEWRNVFRSTSMHNCLTVDGQSSSVPGTQPFNWAEIANCTSHCWHENSDFCFFEGSHDGYKRLPVPATHTRSVLSVCDEYWFLLDSVDSDGKPLLEVHFHFSAGVVCKAIDSESQIVATKNSTSLTISYPELSGKWQISDGFTSRCYGQKEKSAEGTYVVKASGRSDLLAVLFPQKQDDEPPVISMLCPSVGKGVLVAGFSFRDVLVWSATSLIDYGIKKTDFEWVWVRRSPDGLLKKAISLHGSRLEISEISIELDDVVDSIVLKIELDRLAIEVAPICGLSIKLRRPFAEVVVNGTPQNGRDPDSFRVTHGQASNGRFRTDRSTICKYRDRCTP